MPNSPCRIDNSHQEHSNCTLAETHSSGNAGLPNEQHQNSLGDLFDIQEFDVNAHAVINRGTNQARECTHQDLKLECQQSKHLTIGI